jgi:hypothetical protein
VQQARCKMPRQLGRRVHKVGPPAKSCHRVRRQFTSRRVSDIDSFAPYQEAAAAGNVREPHLSNIAPFCESQQ